MAHDPDTLRGLTWATRAVPAALAVRGSAFGLVSGLLLGLGAVSPAQAGENAPAVTGLAVELVMVEQPGCAYCRAWHAEIGPAYPNTEAGAFAPLRTEQLRAIPDGLDLARRVVFTPTFVLVDGAGRELGRIEGYPGDDFFWPLLERMLTEAAGFTLTPEATGTMTGTTTGTTTGAGTTTDTTRKD